MKKNGEFVGVDEKFIPEDEKYVEDSILGNKEESKKKVKKIAKAVGIGYLVWIGLALVIVLTIAIFTITQFSKFSKMGQGLFTQFDGKQSEILNEANSLQSEILNTVNNVQSGIKDAQKQSEISTFNNPFEIYSGTSSKLFATSLLDKVVTNNKTNSDKIITVEYGDIITTNTDEIVELKKSFESGKDYEISLDYNEEGFVNKVTIENV